MWARGLIHGCSAPAASALPQSGPVTASELKPWRWSSWHHEIAWPQYVHAKKRNKTSHKSRYLLGTKSLIWCASVKGCHMA